MGPQRTASDGWRSLAIRVAWWARVWSRYPQVVVGKPSSYSDTADTINGGSPPPLLPLHFAPLLVLCMFITYMHVCPPRLGTETDRRDESENEREEGGEGGSRVPVLFSSCGVSSLLISFSSSSSSSGSSLWDSAKGPTDREKGKLFLLETKFKDLLVANRASSLHACRFSIIRCQFSMIEISFGFLVRSVCLAWEYGGDQRSLTRFLYWFVYSERTVPILSNVTVLVPSRLSSCCAKSSLFWDLARSGHV